MEAFAEEQKTGLRGLLALPHGIPAPDPSSDGRGRIDPGAFRTAFTAWATAALPGAVAGGAGGARFDESGFAGREGTVHAVADDFQLIDQADVDRKMGCSPAAFR